MMNWMQIQTKVNALAHVEVAAAREKRIGPCEALLW